MSPPFGFGKEDSLCFLLRKEIREFKKIHPNYSSSQLARNWGLSSSSFNRIENLEVQSPSVDHVEKVLKGCGKEVDILPTLKKFYPKMTSIFEWLFNKKQEYLEEEQRGTLDNLALKRHCF